MKKSTALLSSLLLLSLPFIFSFYGKGNISPNDDQLRLSIVNTFAVEDTSRNEVPVILGDFADPSIIRIGNTYYATGTSSEWAPHFPLFESTDLFNWKQIGFVFNQTPAWAAASFWAPELFYYKGTYYVYYVARKKSDGISCIGVATSKDPSKGFTDKGIVLEFGKEAIDPFLIVEGGELYMTWKAYGLDQRPIEILGARMSDDGFKVIGEPFMLLRDDAKQGLEGQCLVKRDGYYYLFYSPGNCCGRGCSYKTEVARSESLKGPYTKFPGNPVLSESEDWKCTGHGTIVTSKEGRDYFLYHAYSKTADVFTGRQGMLGEVLWDKQTGWPDIKPLGENAKVNKAFKDDFSNKRLSGSWQWDFRHATPKWKIEKSALHLSGDVNSKNLTGTVLTVRPVTPNYEMTTEVLNINTSLKGLVLYGDAGQSVGIGVKNNVVQVWEVKKEKRSVLKEEILNSKRPVKLKMIVEQGYKLRFYYSEVGGVWKELSTGADHYDGNFLPPWDRSPRPGLMQQGTEAARFDNFQIIYS